MYRSSTVWSLDGSIKFKSYDRNSCCIVTGDRLFISGEVTVVKPSLEASECSCPTSWHG